MHLEPGSEKQAKNVDFHTAEMSEYKRHTIYFFQTELA